MVQERFLLQMLLPAQTSPLPGTEWWSCSGHIKLWLPAYVPAHIIRYQGLPLPLFTYFEKLIHLLSISHTMVLAGQTGHALASTSAPTTVSSATEAHSAWAQICTQVAKYTTSRSLGTQLKHNTDEANFLPNKQRTHWPHRGRLRLSPPTGQAHAYLLC